MINSRIHAGICALFETAGQSDCPTHSELLDIIATPHLKSWMVLTEPDGEVVGFATASAPYGMREQPGVAMHDTPEVVIHEFILFPYLTTTATGKALLEQILRWARLREASRVTLLNFNSSGDLETYFAELGFMRNEDLLFYLPLPA